MGELSLQCFKELSKKHAMQHVSNVVFNAVKYFCIFNIQHKYYINLDIYIFYYIIIITTA